MKEIPKKNTHNNWNQLKNYLKSTLDSIPSKLSSKRNNLPWMTSETKKMCRKKRRYYNRAKAGSTKHRDMYTQLQNATRDALRRDHWNYINGILQEGQETGDNKFF